MLVRLMSRCTTTSGFTRPLRCLGGVSVLSFVVGFGELPPNLVAGELHRGRCVQ